MEWVDDAIVLAVRPFGETSSVVDLLTREHGRHAGLVRGARGKALRAVAQPGNEVRATWRARLDDHLGTLTLDMTRGHAARAMADRHRLTALNALAATARAVLPERVPYASVYEGARTLLDLLDQQEIWPALYVRWEVGVLAELGFGLDLSRCAATGAMDDLAYVSPRTGRAVSRAAGAPYHDKLLKLPAFLLGAQAGEASGAAIAAGLQLTGHFLDRQILGPLGRDLPAARARFALLAEAQANATPDTGG